MSDVSDSDLENGQFLATLNESNRKGTSNKIVDPDSESSLIIANGITADGVGASRMREEVVDAAPSYNETIPPLFLAIQLGDTRGIDSILRSDPKLVNNPRYRGFPPLHFACNVGNVMAIKDLIYHGANVGAYDSFGNTALHLAVSHFLYEGLAELLSHGASPDVKNEPPKFVREMKSETPLHTAARLGHLESASLLLDYKADVNICDSDNSTVLHLAAQSHNLNLVNILLKEKKSQESITWKDDQGNTVLHTALTNCEPENEHVQVELFQKLIKHGVIVNDSNKKGETPLFLAAQKRMSKLVEYLLSVGADPTSVTHEGQTVIHAACIGGCASCLSHLLNTNLLSSMITHADDKGQEPFHFAVKSSSIDCCMLLLSFGDHLTRKDINNVSRFSLVMNHLPSAIQLFQQLFDAHVHISNQAHHDPDFHVSFDYTPLLSQEDVDSQTSVVSELTASNLEPLLKHPLLESFLYLKWQKIKTFFYVSVALYFLYLIIHTIFIIAIFGHLNIQADMLQKNLWIFIILHGIIFLLILIPDVIIIMANFKKYLLQLETYTKLIALASSAIVLFSYSVPVPVYIRFGFEYISDNVTDAIVFPDEENRLIFNNISNDNVPYDKTKVKLVRYAAAISSLFCWIEFMMLLSRFPSLGTYVMMFTKVSKSILLFTLAFSSLLIGFALCFMVLFYESPTFKNFPSSLIRTIMMMIGDIGYGDLYKDLQMPTISLISLVVFLFLVCIVMSNLLVGLAVSDIPELRRQGKIRRLSKQAAYLVSYEKLIGVAKRLSCFPSSLRILMANRSNIHRKKSVYPNLSNKETKYNTLLPPRNIQEAILLGSSDESKEDITNTDDEDIRTIFKSFRVKYNLDRKFLRKKLAQVNDNPSADKTITERLDHMQRSMESQLKNLSIQLQQQMLQNRSHVERIQFQHQTDATADTIDYHPWREPSDVNATYR